MKIEGEYYKQLVGDEDDTAPIIDIRIDSVEIKQEAQPSTEAIDDEAEDPSTKRRKLEVNEAFEPQPGPSGLNTRRAISPDRSSVASSLAS